MKRFLNKFLAKKSVSVICTVLFAVLVGGYIAAHILGGFSERLTITPAIIANESTYETYDAFIFRDENVLTSPYSGYRLDILSDGEMAGIGTELARVYDTVASEDLDDTLADLDRVIALSELCSVALTASGIESARAVLRTGYREIVDSLSSKDPASAIKRKDALIEAFSVLYINMGTSSTVEENLTVLKAQTENLKNERARLVSSLGSVYDSLKAEKTGYYYSGTDGFEALMSSSGISEKSFEELMASINTLLNGTENAAGAGKMVYDPHWYAALPVDMSVAIKYMNSDGSAKSRAYTVSVYDGEWRELEMDLERVVRSTDGDRAILIFSSSVMDVGFSVGRSCRVRIHTREYEGYRVPLSAVYERNGKAGVYVLTYGTVEWRYVEEIYRGDSYILAKKHGSDDTDGGPWLSLNDSLIVAGNDLYDGKTVD